MLVYLNGNFLPREQAKISVDDRGFLFGDSLYEVIRSYQGLLFEHEAHLRRLQNGLHALRLRVAEFDRLVEIAQRLLAENDLLERRRDDLFSNHARRGVSAQACLPPFRYAAHDLYCRQQTRV